MVAIAVSEDTPMSPGPGCAGRARDLRSERQGAGKAMSEGHAFDPRRGLHLPQAGIRKFDAWLISSVMGFLFRGGSDGEGEI